MHYKIIASASANKTYQTQLTELLAVWNTLTDDEKSVTTIRLGNSTYYVKNAQDVFTLRNADGNERIISLSNKTYGNIALGGSSITDYSTSTNSSTLRLVQLVYD